MRLQILFGRLKHTSLVAVSNAILRKKIAKFDVSLNTGSSRVFSVLPAIGQWTGFFARPKVACKMLDVRKSKRLRNLPHRQIRLYEQAHDLVCPYAPDVFMDGAFDFPAELDFQRAA